MQNRNGITIKEAGMAIYTQKNKVDSLRIPDPQIKAEEFRSCLTRTIGLPEFQASKAIKEASSGNFVHTSYTASIRLSAWPGSI